MTTKRRMALSRMSQTLRRTLSSKLPTRNLRRLSDRAERSGQEARGGGPDQVLATDLGPIDFAAFARACGARGIRVETDAAFEQAIRQAMANDRPTVIQVALDRGWVHPDRPGPSGPDR